MLKIATCLAILQNKISRGTLQSAYIATPIHTLQSTYIAIYSYIATSIHTLQNKISNGTSK
jgi:hypothetical protein